MRTLNLFTASAWDIGIALESERLARLDDYLDGREPREDPGHSVEFMDEED